MEEKFFEGMVRIPSGCAISGFIHRDGGMSDGGAIIASIATMRERSNGLGGGFAGYGIYPEYKDYYALHLFYLDKVVKRECESFLEERFDIINLSKIPVRKTPGVVDAPLIWRYFVSPLPTRLAESQLDEDEFVSRCSFFINTNMKGAYVFSCGKNMGAFKAVGYPEDVGEFYRLDEYKAYSWIAHGRYPTNTPGWWGGAHPFCLLDMAIVHNGEISSYDANRRNMEMHGYKCNLQTDTEVITYIFDYLVRKRGLTLKEACAVIAAPFWHKIERMPEKERERAEFLRRNFSGLLVTGPFSVILGYKGGLLAINDRLKLRSMVVGEYKNTTYMASEECAIRAIAPVLDRLYAPEGGEAVIAEVMR